MNKTGKEVMQAITDRIKWQKRISNADNHVKMIMSLSRYEMSQLVTFGTIDRWEREKVTEENLDDFDQYHTKQRLEELKEKLDKLTKDAPNTDFNKGAVSMCVIVTQLIDKMISDE